MRISRTLRTILLSIPVVLFLLIVWFIIVIHLPTPVENGENTEVPIRTQDAEGRFWVDRNWLRHDVNGLHETYIEGAPLERGLAYGSLGRELIEEQERIFIGRIRTMIPGEWRIRFLKYFVAWFNRDLGDHVPHEYQREIYGVSRSFSDSFDEVGPKFMRALNYHAAHDIGHALQDLALVGCTSFAAWGDRTPDGSLLIARNFDFWMGDDFARDKLITFIKPDQGSPHVIVSWGGFMGAASAMNLEGITVTINASRSSMPVGARLPISLLARNIVQYATTIEEAIAIADAHEVFVSESILVASASEGRAVNIEKAPDGMGVLYPEKDLIVCANHYQSPQFDTTAVNKANKRESDSMFRMKRMRHLVDSVGVMAATDAVAILRDRKGPGATDVGLGSPMAINQLIAHHAVVFQPEDRIMWVSTSHYQCGAFVGYDLREVFTRCETGDVSGPLYDPALTIPADEFVNTDAFAKYKEWNHQRVLIAAHIAGGDRVELKAQDERKFIALNPLSYISYMILGELHRANGDMDMACSYYEQALQREVASLQERWKIEQRMEKCASDPEHQG